MYQPSYLIYSLFFSLFIYSFISKLYTYLVIDRAARLAAKIEELKRAGVSEFDGGEFNASSYDGAEDEVGIYDYENTFINRYFILIRILIFANCQSQI